MKIVVSVTIGLGGEKERIKKIGAWGLQVVTQDQKQV